MKTTIKIDSSKSLVVEPAPGGGVMFSALLHGFKAGSHVGTPDQCSVLIFAIEQALEVSGCKAVTKKLQGQGVRCHDGSACAAGQRVCPTPGACGIAP